MESRGHCVSRWHTSTAGPTGIMFLDDILFRVYARIPPVILVVSLKASIVHYMNENCGMPDFMAFLNAINYTVCVLFYDYQWRPHDAQCNFLAGKYKLSKFLRKIPNRLLIFSWSMKQLKSRARRQLQPKNCLPWRGLRRRERPCWRYEITFTNCSSDSVSLKFDSILQEMGYKEDAEDQGRRRTRSGARPPPPATPPPTKKEKKTPAASTGSG